MFSSDFRKQAIPYTFNITDFQEMRDYKSTMPKIPGMEHLEEDPGLPLHHVVHVEDVHHPQLL